MKLNLYYRFLAVVALILYVILISAIVFIFISNLGITLVFGVTSLLLAYLVWLIFTDKNGGSKVIKLLALLAGISMFAEVLIFLSNEANRRALVLIILLSIFYIGLFTYLRNKYWVLLRKEAFAKNKTANFKNPYLIINPKSGNGRSIKASIDKIAKQQGINVIMTKKDVDISISALEAVRSGADVIGISGGDGSIGAVAKVAIDNNLPIVVLPGGTRCHFAKDIGLDPKYIVDALAGFTGIERLVDIGEINGRIFLNNASFGLYADIVDNPEYRENKLKVSQQVLQSIVSGEKDAYNLQFSHDKLKIKKAVQVLVGVNQYQTMKIFELGHREKLDEGVLQITTITKLDNELIKQLFKSIKIKGLRLNTNLSGFHQWLSKSIIIKSQNKKIIVGVDGERESYNSPVTVKVLPKSLRVYIPAEGVRSRRKNPFDSKVVSKIWQTTRNS